MMKQTIITILLASMSICLSLSVASCQPKSSKLEGTGMAEGKELEKEIEERVTSIYETVFDWYNTHNGMSEKHQYDDEFLTQDFLLLQSKLDSISKIFNECPSILVDFDHWTTWTTSDVYERYQMDFSVDSVDVFCRDSAKVYMTIGKCPKNVLLKMAYTDSPQCKSTKAWFIDDFCVDGVYGPYSFSNKRCMQECIVDYQRLSEKRSNLRTHK